MKRVRSTLAFLLLVALMAACSTKPAAQPEAPTAPAPSSDAKPADAPKPVPEKYDPPIELTTIHRRNATLKYAADENENNNPWTQAYLEKFGIRTKVIFTTAEQAQWEQRTNLIIASGDLPDFFMATPAQFKQLAEAGLLEDMTDAFEQHASARVKEVMNEGGPLPLQSARINGRLMAIPFTGVPKEGAPVLWVRTDWLKKLNLPEPKTIADLQKISEAFTTQDPDANGVADTFGLLIDKDLTMLGGLYNGHHAYNGIWIKDSAGKLVSSTIQPEMKQALQTLQGLYQAGQIDKEFGVKTASKVYETLVAGKAGLFYASGYAGLFPLNSVKEKHPESEWQAYAMPSIDGKPAKAQAGLGVVGYWVVKKGVKNPEAILKMMQFWIDTFYDNTDDAIFGKYVDRESDGSAVWTMNLAATYRAFKNAEQQELVSAVLRAPEASRPEMLAKLTPESRAMYNRINGYLTKDEIQHYGWHIIFGEPGSMGVINQYRKDDRYVSDAFITSPLPTMAERGATLSKRQLEVFTRIIQGAPIDEFDKWVEEWKRTGGDQITQEVNDWYAKQ